PRPLRAAPQAPRAVLHLGGRGTDAAPRWPRLSARARARRARLDDARARARLDQHAHPPRARLLRGAGAGRVGDARLRQGSARAPARSPPPDLLAHARAGRAGSPDASLLMVRY